MHNQQSLNPAQQEAVTAPIGHQLVLAGAGSGKTRVLTHRIAWLIEHEQVGPYNILAVTFTNKAAHEMRGRLEGMLKYPIENMWIGTFHGISHRFLRANWQVAGLTQHFQILDSDDQFRLIRRLIHGMNLDPDRYQPKAAQWFINHQKEEGLLPHQAEPHAIAGDVFIRIYQTYQETCDRAGVIDFADLLMKTCHLLASNAEIRARYQERFRCILVDEFQDTNIIQYQWLKLFAGEHNALTIVGDDDQSIYGWRGAQIENIQRFTKDFPNAMLVRLEQNYRSTGTILNAANALIAQNIGRLGKNLWTAGQTGDPITLYAGFNEADEAFFIVSRIRELQRNGDYQLREMAILYRSNAQSRVIEEALMQFGLPYRVYGGLRYFDRAEIKDALAYLRLMHNHADDPSFERIINTPTRGIGERTVSVIRDYAHQNHLSLWDALNELLQKKQFSTRSETALTAFVQLISNLAEDTKDFRLAKQVKEVLHRSGLFEHYSKEKGEKGLTRIENLEELVNAAQQFMRESILEDIPPLAAFLAYAALESGDEQINGQEEGVQLMTLHSAKGLEFPVVFLAGCEEELFPHYLSMQDPKAIEEERRLCYVGMTRAMKKLFMTYAEVRHLYGKSVHHRPSRFLHEIPKELIEENRFRVKLTSATNSTQFSHQPVSQGRFRIGQEVHHRVFGEGTVLDCEGDNEDMKVKVRFKEVGTKVLIASYLMEK